MILKHQEKSSEHNTVNAVVDACTGSSQKRVPQQPGIDGGGNQGASTRDYLLSLEYGRGKSFAIIYVGMTSVCK